MNATTFPDCSKWNKCGIVLQPAGTPDERFISNFSSEAEPLGDGRWRIWFSTSGALCLPKDYRIGYAEGVIGEEMQKHYAVLSESEPADTPLSIGNLPKGWNPVQPIHLELEKGKHRLYFWAHGPGVCRYLAAESSDGRRYKVLDPHRPCLYHRVDRAVKDADKQKAMGLTPGQTFDDMKTVEGEPVANPELVVNDATMVYRLDDGTFELYSATTYRVEPDDPGYVPHDNAPGFIRVIDRLESDDGLVWTNRKRVIQKDDADPADMQFYHLSVTHTPEGRIGMLGRYPCIAQTMDIELCSSQDGVTWERSERSAWITRGDDTAPDSGGIYPPHSLVKHDGMWWLFYTAYNVGHDFRNTSGEPPRSVIMLAQMPAD